MGIHKEETFNRVAAVHMTETWKRYTNQKKVVIVVFIDFRKAFDAVPYQILLVMLQHLETQKRC